MLITCNCGKCGKSIGIIQYTDYFYCKNHNDEYVCVVCFENGNKKCNKCQMNLSFHNSDETKKFKRDNNLLFWEITPNNST